METIERHPWVKAFRSECEAKGLIWKETVFDRVSGTTTGLFIGPPNALQSSVILFLHGVGDDLLFPQMLLYRHLLSKGWSIATCDLDGHGQENQSLFTSKGARSIVNQLVSFLESICPGREKLHLIGFSLGGLLMLDYAIHRPERVHTLTLIGCPVTKPERSFLWSELSGFFSAPFSQARREFGLWNAFPAFGPFKRSDFPIRQRYLESDSYEGYISVAEAIFDDIAPLQALPVVTFPTLAVVGSKDHIANSSKTPDLPNISPHIQLQIIDRATHFTTLLDPKTWKRIEIFLRAATRHSL